ncbi:MAG: hypothetical protein GF334_01095 [Candidatus Altiarchaeales archaeon]|nr:hypothetical protein [Candidatus Altiarchaeales archaeon]
MIQRGKPKYSAKDIILLKEHIRKELLGRYMFDTLADLGIILGDRPKTPIPDGDEVLRRIKYQIPQTPHRDTPARMLRLMYEEKLQQMPEYLGGQDPLAQVIASWRLEIGV